MFISPTSAPLRSINSNKAISSITGSVLGKQTIVVIPPATAAFETVSKVSKCPLPGSPVVTLISTKPGAIHLPPQSSTSISSCVVSIKTLGPISSIFPSRIRTLPI